MRVCCQSSALHAHAGGAVRQRRCVRRCAVSPAASHPPSASEWLHTSPCWQARGPLSAALAVKER